MKLSKQYIAGFFDGEGCVSSSAYFKEGKYEKEPRVYLKISVTQKDPRVLYKIKEKYGGTVRIHSWKDGRMLYSWNLTGKMKMLNFLTDIVKYSVQKREQIELAILFTKGIRTENLGCCALPKNIHVERLEIHKKLRELKIIELANVS